LPLAALALIVLAAFTHSTWNLLAKRAALNRHFVWFSSTGETLLFLPLVLWALRYSWVQLNGKALWVLLASGVFELLYALSLQRGYQVADLSLVYPLARGSGSFMSFLGAIVLLGERLSLPAAVGALLVSSGILVLTGAFSQRDHSWSGSYWGVITGFAITGYTLFDGYAIRTLLISPIPVAYAGNLFRATALCLRTCRERSTLRLEFVRCWREVLGVAFLTPTTYMLVLLAMRLAPVSHVAPAREMSMMIGAYLGARLLNEGHLARRLTGSALIIAGVAALAAG
jgi:drug/metabolite transporter (DMT)-like permease